MIIENCISFHYLILEMFYEFRQIDIIKDFENCISEYNEMCGCERLTKLMKENQCEEKYINIISNHMDKIKHHLLNHMDEYTFNTQYPEKRLIAFISRIN